jgi:hypothetical protein
MIAYHRSYHHIAVDQGRYDERITALGRERRLLVRPVSVLADLNNRE